MDKFFLVVFAVLLVGNIALGRWVQASSDALIVLLYVRLIWPGVVR